jgi:hypothetical protein
MKDEALSNAQEQLRMKDTALSAAQRAGPEKVEQLATDDVKVGKAPRTCLNANANIEPPSLQIKWKDQVRSFVFTAQVACPPALPLIVMSAAGRQDSPHSGHPWDCLQAAADVNVMDEVSSSPSRTPAWLRSMLRPETKMWFMSGSMKRRTANGYDVADERVLLQQADRLVCFVASEHVCRSCKSTDAMHGPVIAPPSPLPNMMETRPQLLSTLTFYRCEWMAASKSRRSRQEQSIC